MLRGSLASALALALVLSGCATLVGRDDGNGPSEASYPRCVHPWPCGNGTEWPERLAGPFEILPAQNVRVKSFDGVELDGAVWLPKLPEGVRAPTVLKSTPYLGTCAYQELRGVKDGDLPGCPGGPESQARLGGDNFRELLQDGYAVAIFAVRGTGASGGCLDLWGADEQRDQAVLVEWLAQQEWSNGRVAMMGLSYAGTTPWEAAVQAPPALKAILTLGIITDVYLSLSSPQGAVESGYDTFQGSTATANSLQPPWQMDAVRMLQDYAPVAKDRLCPELVDVYTVNSIAGRADERPKAWFDERRLTERIGNVTAAVLVAQGMLDNNFHRYQDDTIWPLIDAPKWFVEGQWAHTYGFDDQLVAYEHAKSWYDLQRVWLDFWLKGVGDPPRMGVFDYQDSAMAWRSTTAWPPLEARAEALYLAGETLAGAAADATRTFSAAPQGACAAGLICEGADYRCESASPLPPGLVYSTRPLDEAVVLAGNPFALLTITSDQAGGTFAVDLARIPSGGTCEDAKLVSDGGVDLRFHEGNFDAKPFSTGSPQTVRVDFYNVAVRLEPGDRLVLYLRHPYDRDTREFTPTITVLGSSHLVLPLVEGSMGGAAPLAAYPPRPFAEPTPPSGGAAGSS